MEHREQAPSSGPQNLHQAQAWNHCAGKWGLVGCSTPRPMCLIGTWWHMQLFPLSSVPLVKSCSLSLKGTTMGEPRNAQGPGTLLRASGDYKFRALDLSFLGLEIEAQGQTHSRPLHPSGEPGSTGGGALCSWDRHVPTLWKGSLLGSRNCRDQTLASLSPIWSRGSPDHGGHTHHCHACS